MSPQSKNCLNNKMLKYIFIILQILVATALCCQVRYGRLVYVAVDSANNERPYSPASNWADTIVVMENGEYTVKAIDQNNMKVFYERERDSFTVLFSPEYEISFSNLDTSFIWFYDIKAKKSFSYKCTNHILQQVISFDMGNSGTVTNYYVDKTAKLRVNGVEGYFVSYDFQRKSLIEQVKMYVTEQVLIPNYAALPHPINIAYCPLYLEVEREDLPKQKTIYKLVEFEKLPRKAIKKIENKIKQRNW